jgi:hypothetical protein
MLESLRQLGAGLDSETPITVRGCWNSVDPLPNGGVTLAAAGPSGVVIADRTLVFEDGGRPRTASYLPDKYAFYARAPAARLAGTRACSLNGGGYDLTDFL